MTPLLRPPGRQLLYSLAIRRHRAFRHSGHILVPLVCGPVECMMRHVSKRCCAHTVQRESFVGP